MYTYIYIYNKAKIKNSLLSGPRPGIIHTDLICSKGSAILHLYFGAAAAAPTPLVFCDSLALSFFL